MGAVQSCASFPEREQYASWTLNDVKATVSRLHAGITPDGAMCSPDAVGHAGGRLTHMLLQRRDFFDAFCDSSAMFSGTLLRPVLTVDQFEVFARTSNGAVGVGQAKAARAIHVLIVLILCCQVPSTKERVEMLYDVFFDDCAPLKASDSRPLVSCSFRRM